MTRAVLAPHQGQGTAQGAAGVLSQCCSAEVSFHSQRATLREGLSPGKTADSPTPTQDCRLPFSAAPWPLTPPGLSGPSAAVCQCHL